MHVSNRNVSSVTRQLMEHFVVHSALGTFSSAILWGGLAVGAAVFALLLISEGNSGARPPGCRRSMGAGKPLP